MQHQNRYTDAQYLDAIEKGDVEFVKRFLAQSQGFDIINARTHKQNIPALSLAIMKKQTAIALLIINAGANVNAEFAKGMNPLMLAAGLGNIKVLQALLNIPLIKINKVDFRGYNPLETAAMHGHIEAVKALLDAGAAIQKEDFLAELKSKGNPQIIALLSDYAVKKLASFEIPESEINPADKSIILKLSARNMARLKKVTTKLYHQGGLNSHSFSTLVRQVSGKNPDIQPSKVETPPEAPAMSSVSGMTFYLHKTPLFTGGQGTIYGGYVSPAAALPRTPDYCIKKFTARDNDTAIHEAKYLLLAGRRTAIVTTGDSTNVVTEWQRGEDLATLSEKIDFKTLPLARRIHWLASGLNDLEKFHAAFRIHADMKPLNFIVDMATDQMKLIDMGAAQKINSPKDKVTTPGFIDLKEGFPKKMASDMYSMGKIMSFMFPDLYKCDVRAISLPMKVPNAPHINVDVGISYFTKIKTTNLTPIESALMQLVDAMMEATAEHRCTCEQALKFCNGLLQKIVNDQITPEELTDLLNTTINRKEFTVEDALRDSSRPALIATRTQEEPRIVGSKVIEPPSEIVAPTSAKKAKPEEEERKPRAKHAESPAVMFNPASKTSKKKQKEEARPVRAVRKKKGK